MGNGSQKTSILDHFGAFYSLCLFLPRMNALGGYFSLDGPIPKNKTLSKIPAEV